MYIVNYILTNLFQFNKLLKMFLNIQVLEKIYLKNTYAILFLILWF